MPRRPLRFADLDAALADADRLLAGGYDRVGNWSLAQIATHLAKVVTMSLDGFPTRMPWFVTAVVRWVALKAVLRRDVFKVTLPSPKFLQPGDIADDRAAVESLRAAVARLLERTEPMAPSPVFGKLTNDEWRTVHLWHCEHHLSFLLPGGA